MIDVNGNLWKAGAVIIGAATYLFLIARRVGALEQSVKTLIEENRETRQRIDRILEGR